MELRIRPVAKKHLTYEIMMPVSEENDDQANNFDAYMSGQDQRRTISTLMRHELQVELLGVPLLESQKQR